MEFDKVGKKVEIFCNNDFHYIATILDEDNFFVLIKDKVGKTIYLNKKDISSIKIIEEEGNEP